MKTIITIFFSLTLMSLYAQMEDRQIRDRLDFQKECWNNGDILCFMEAYWNSDRVVLIGGSGLIYGWDRIYAHYKEHYPDETAMGTVDFEIELLEPIGESHWQMIGQWKLIKGEEEFSGYFTLMWRNVADEWVIVSEHSS